MAHYGLFLKKRSCGMKKVPDPFSIQGEIFYKRECSTYRYSMITKILVTLNSYTNINIMIMNIIFWIIFGGLVGWVASLIMNTDGQQGILLNVVIGIIGAALGGWIMSIIGGDGVDGFNIYSFLVALLGATVLIWIVKAIRG